MKLLLSMFAYPFIVRAFVVGILVSLCASLLGVPLVLKRYSMIGDGLSHVSFGALSVAVACGFAPLWFSIPVVVIAAFILMHVAEKSRVSADAMIAVFSASALAIGVIVTSLTTGMTTDVDSYMFGSILAMSRSDVILSVTLALCVLALYILFYHKLFSVTFDESFARATGVRVGTYKTILSVLTALTVVLGMRMMGAMLLSSLIIFPALSAMRVFKSFRSVVCFAAGLSVMCFCLGLTGSYLLSTPVGATVNGRDFAPHFAACLETGCTSDATELIYNPETKDIEFVEPAAGGKIMAVITIPVLRPQVGTIRPGTFKIVPAGKRESFEIIHESIGFDEEKIRTKLLEYKANDFDPELDIASCETIVCVGNGVKDESLDKYRELAKLLGGKLAGTRPVVDRELLPYKLQVGQSGVIVKPKLYIGFGVSGAVNHVTGVDAELFIAVNKDANAPIFNYCDYGVVGDMDEVCDHMIELLKK